MIKEYQVIQIDFLKFDMIKNPFRNVLIFGNLIYNISFLKSLNFL